MAEIHEISEMNDRLVSGAEPLAIVEPLAPNPRVQFMLGHWYDLALWRMIPIWLGVAMAPLYDHRDPSEVLAIGAVIVIGNMYLVRWIGPLIEARVGIFGAAFFRPENTAGLPEREPIFGPEAGNKIQMRDKVPGRVKWLAFAVSSGVVLLMVYMHRGIRFYRPDGTIEGMCGMGMGVSIIRFLQRAFDSTNYKPRQYWYCFAAVVMTVGCYYLGLTPGSFAVLLVLLGTTNIVVALLDLWMMLHFASTPLVDAGSVEMEDTHG